MFDRVLLLLLVILLPLGIIVSRVFTGDFSLANNQSTAVDEKKIEEVVQRLQPQQSSTAPTSVKGFNVTGMVYASDSGKLKVVGIAPNNQQLMWIWVASNRTKNSSKKAASPSALPESKPLWDGPLVIEPNVGGFFAVDVDVSLMAGVVEIRLEQGAAVTVARYDLDKKSQL